jgi:protein SCO1
MSPGFIPLLALVLTAGIGAFGWETDGFRVVTSDGAWQLAVSRNPVPVPNVRLFDQNGKAFSLSDYLGKVLLVNFIYTRCPTLCSLLSDDFRDVQESRANTRGIRDIRLLSISFDPEHDNVRARKRYGERYGAVAARWRIAAPAAPRDLATLLRSFGVVIVPDGNGGFVHGDYVYLVDARGRLMRILDPNTPPRILASALAASGS